MKKLNSQFGFLKKLATAILVFVSRFGMLPANISPLGSYGFFGQNIYLFFFTIILFDFLKGGFYSGFLFTYLGFFSYWMFGKVVKTKKIQFFLLPLASFAFFLISNLGVWWYWYSHTVSGLATCYTLAIPFYKNTLIGDLVFGYGFMVLRYFAELIANNKNRQVLNDKASILTQ